MTIKDNDHYMRLIKTQDGTIRKMKMKDRSVTEEDVDMISPTTDMKKHFIMIYGGWFITLLHRHLIVDYEFNSR